MFYHKMNFVQPLSLSSYLFCLHRITFHNQEYQYRKLGDRLSGIYNDAILFARVFCFKK